jgi:hypothetical protein
MKTAELIPSSTSHRSASDRPFFSKKEDGTFFSASAMDIQAKPFFDNTHEPVDSGIETINGREEAGSGLQAVPTEGLTIGKPGDRFEKEADAVADRVVRKLAEPAVNQEDKETETLQEDAETEGPGKNCRDLPTGINENNGISLKADTDTGLSDVRSTSGVKVTNGAESGLSTSPVPQVQTTCEECEKEEKKREEEPELQRKPVSDGGNDPLEKDDEFLAGRSWEEEQAVKEIMFKTDATLQMSGSTGATDETSVRDRIVKMARQEIGKVEAKRADSSGRRVGYERLLEYFHLAAPGEWPDEVIENAKYGEKHFPHWCGIFSVYAIKKAGIDVGNWKMGTGVSQFNTLEQTDTPKKGDIGYIHKPYRHHCIIEEVNGDSVKSIDGNSGPVSGVLERTRPISEYTGFFTAFTGSEKYIQKKEEDGTTASTHTSLQEKLENSSGKGMPLDQSARGEMESAFGTDFSQVKIHADSEAVKMNKDLHAQAFTHGPDIFFNEGKYHPDTTEGKHLLAHELTHTMQQGANIQKMDISASGKAPDVQCVAPVFIWGGRLLAGKLIRWGISKALSSESDLISMASVIRKELLQKPIDLMGQTKFNPPSYLADHIQSFGLMAEWYKENKSIATKFGIRFSEDLVKGPKLNIRFGKLAKREGVRIRWHESSRTYEMNAYFMLLNHNAFDMERKGSVPYMAVGINKKDSSVYGGIAVFPSQDYFNLQATDRESMRILMSKEALAQLVFGDDYDQAHFNLVIYINDILGGILTFHFAGFQDLGKDQFISGALVMMNEVHVWSGSLKGKAKGLQDYEVKIKRNTLGSLFGEALDFKLDGNWTSGKPDSEDGVFTVNGSFRASYKDKTLELFGKASYQSARISGEVNVAMTEESKAQALFKAHVPATKVKDSVEPGIKADGDNPDMLALTAWGNLMFKLIDIDENVKKGKQGSPGTGKKSILQDLEGEGAFIVSPEGHIILSGNLTFPANWKFTDNIDYKSDDAKNKHLFEKDFTVIRAPVPYGTIVLDLGTTLDVGVHLDPLELYEIEISGVYSNHPDYRSEVGITPRFYVSGFADASIGIAAKAKAKALGLFTVGEIKGDMTGKAKFEAYINASPALRMIWENKEQPAQYGLAGTAHAGGELTFRLDGSITVEVIKKEILKTKKYEIGSWTLGNFGIELVLNEYILGSGEKPEISYDKIKFGKKQRKNLGRAVISGKEVAEGETDERKGGFSQVVDGKDTEVGEFSTEKPERADPNQEVVGPDTISSQFMMGKKLHILYLTLSGTKGDPHAVLEMASNGKEPLKEKIEEEKSLIEVSDAFTLNEGIKEQLESQKTDLENIQKEVIDIEKNARNSAKSMGDDENIEVAGFETVDDRLTLYAERYNTDDIGGKTIKQIREEGKEQPAEQKPVENSHGCGSGEVKDLAKTLNDGWSPYERTQYYFRNKGAGCITFHFDDGGLIVVKVAVLSGKSGHEAINSAFAVHKKQFDNYKIALPSKSWIPSGNAGQNQYHSENLILDYLRQLSRGDTGSRVIALSVRIYTLLTPCDRCDPLLGGNMRDIIRLGDKQLDYQTGNAPTGRTFVKDSSDQPPYGSAGSKTQIEKTNPNYESAKALTKDQEDSWFKTFEIEQ